MNQDDDRRWDVVTVGETMLAFHIGSALSIGAAASVGIAGCESNVAIGLARLGHRVKWISLLGDDEPGRLVARTLEQEGVSVDAPLTPGAETGVLTYDRAPWDRLRASYRRAHSAASTLGLADLPRTLAETASWVHVSGITAGLTQDAAALVATLLKDAREKGSRTSFDVNYRSALWTRSDASEALAPLARGVDVLLASEDELTLVSDGGSEEEQAEYLLSSVSWLAIKRGAAGASFLHHGSRWDLPAVPVPVVSPVGAGDAFTAGVLSGLLDELEPEAVLRRASFLGAAVVTNVSDWRGLPYRSELDECERRLGEHAEVIR